MRTYIFPPTGQLSTRMRIFHAVDKPIDSMTVKDICTKAGISRQLFYRYFDSKYDIAFWYTKECCEASLYEIGRSLTWIDGMELFFNSIYTERNTLAQFVMSKGSIESKLSADAKLDQVLQETLKDYHHIEMNDDLVFVCETFANTFNEVLARWIRAGFNPEPDIMANRMRDIAPSKLLELLEPTESERASKSKKA